MKRNALPIVVAFAFLLVVLPASGQTATPTQGSAPVKRPWDKSLVSEFSRLGVQEGGRVKPIDTFAGFKLLKFNGRRKCRDLVEHSMGPSEWLLDCLFYPEDAKQYKTFRVDNSDVLVALGLPFEKKRARYSYQDLAPAREKLFAFAHDLTAKPAEQRTVVESQALNLADNLAEFESLIDYLEFARHAYNIEAIPVLASVFPGQTKVKLSEILTKGPEFIQAIRALHAGKTPEQASTNPEMKAVEKLLTEVDDTAGIATAMRLFPPSPGSENTEWLTPKDVVETAFGAGTPLPQQSVWVAALEKLVSLREDAGAFDAEFATFSKSLVDAATARGEYAKVPMEVVFYRAQFFYYGLMLFTFAFLLVAFLWLKPGSRLLSSSAMLAILAGLVLLTAGITMRCIIRGRPPVTTLYETILFVTLVAVAVSVFIEFVNRQRVALALAAVLGTLGMFIANKYEVREGVDTMPSMVAVLDTNFWLATHVTTITIGYGAGFLAAALAHVWVFGKLLGFRKKEPTFYPQLSKLVYGVLCFSLVFSIIGTVLGGIWANESWGRFWGWDPKENGALMIVLWQLAVLHARRGGWIRNAATNLAAIFGGIVVAFSWFGVNMLGVGLHSYGFTTGVYRALLAFYAAEMGVLLLGGFIWFGERKPEVAAKGTPRPKKA